LKRLPEVDLPGGCVVIGDLHLSPEGDPCSEGAARWLEAQRDIPRLVILGDLFDYWIGPAQLGMRGAARVVQALRALTGNGVPVDVVVGNRDVMMGAAFEHASGCRLRLDGFVGVTGGEQRLLFIHGDELSTLDHGYQRLRRVLRHPVVRFFARCAPRTLSTWLALRLRRASTRAVASKAPAKVELQASACESNARAAQAPTVVCGHAHQYRDLSLSAGIRWIVLDAFGGARDCLRIGPDGALHITPSGYSSVTGDESAQA